MLFLDEVYGLYLYLVGDGIWGLGIDVDVFVFDVVE